MKTAFLMIFIVFAGEPPRVNMQETTYFDTYETCQSMLTKTILHNLELGVPIEHMNGGCYEIVDLREKTP